jgi:hypothetical protein
VAARSKAWTVFAHSNAGVVGSYPALGMDVCAFILCLWCHVQVAALRQVYPPSRESNRLCVGLRSCKAAKVQRARREKPLISQIWKLALRFSRWWLNPLVSAGLLLSLFLDPEDGCDMFLRFVCCLWIIRLYNTEYRILNKSWANLQFSFLLLNRMYAK